MLIILLFVSAAFAALGSYTDINSSIKFIYYSGQEGMKLSKDKYGWFNTKLNVIGSAVIILALMSVGLFMHTNIAFIGGASIGLILFGILRYIVGRNNEKINKYYRATFQIPTLRFIKENGTFPNDIHLGSSLKWEDYDDRHFYRLFGWVYSNNKDAWEANKEVNDKLVEISKKPEAEWFPK